MTKITIHIHKPANHMHIHCNFAELRFDKTAITCVVLNMRVYLLEVDVVVVWFSAQLQTIFLITEMIDRIGLIGILFWWYEWGKWKRSKHNLGKITNKPIRRACRSCSSIEKSSVHISLIHFSISKPHIPFWGIGYFQWFNTSEHFLCSRFVLVW